MVKYRQIEFKIWLDPKLLHKRNSFLNFSDTNVALISGSNVKCQIFAYKSCYFHSNHRTRLLLRKTTNTVKLKAP